MRLPVIFPLLCYIVGVVLSFLCLFAGHKPGFMEDYAVVRLNTSSLGYNLIDNVLTFGNNGSSPSSDDNDGGGLLDNIIDDAKDALNDISDDIKGLLNDVGNAVADRLADELGVSEWYSVHVMTACQGQFTPNATAPGAGHNTTNCTGSAVGYDLNITKLLDHDLGIGPAHVNLADIGIPDSVQDSVDVVNAAIKAAAVLYILAAALTGTGMLLAAATLALDTPSPPPPRRLLAVANTAVAVLAALVLLAVSVAVTVGARKAVSRINEDGAEVGLSAETGRGFMALSWTAFAMSTAAAMFYVVDMVRAVRGRRRKGVWGKVTI